MNVFLAAPWRGVPAKDWQDSETPFKACCFFPQLPLNPGVVHTNSCSYPNWDHHRNCNNDRGEHHRWYLTVTVVMTPETAKRCGMDTRPPKTHPSPSLCSGHSPPSQCPPLCLQSPIPKPGGTMHPPTQGRPGSSHHSALTISRVFFQFSHVFLLEDGWWLLHLNPTAGWLYLWETTPKTAKLISSTNA